MAERHFYLEHRRLALRSYLVLTLTTPSVVSREPWGPRLLSCLAKHPDLSIHGGLSKGRAIGVLASDKPGFSFFSEKLIQSDEFKFDGIKNGAAWKLRVSQHQT